MDAATLGAYEVEVRPVLYTAFIVSGPRQVVLDEQPGFHKEVDDVEQCGTAHLELAFGSHPVGQLLQGEDVVDTAYDAQDLVSFGGLAPILLSQKTVQFLLGLRV